jgi:hypothetical protein
MTEGEIRQRVRSALLDKRGSELILALIDEIANLTVRTELALRQIQALKSFESLQDHLITVDTPTTGDPRPTILKLDAAQLLNPGDGFHNLEYSLSGVPYRWTGPSQEFSFNVFVSRARPVEMALRATRLMDPKLQSDVVLLADGEPMSLKFVEEGDKWVARTVLPIRTDLGATHLTFVLASVGSPPNSADTRILGIAFHDLEIRPGADLADSRPAPVAMLKGGSFAAPIASSPLVLHEAAPSRRARPLGNGRAEMKRASN